MAAFTADYMKTIKSRSVARGVCPRLLNCQSLNLEVRLSRAAGGSPKSAGKDLQRVFGMSSNTCNLFICKRGRILLQICWSVKDV